MSLTFVQCLKCRWTVVMDGVQTLIFQGWTPSSHFLGQCTHCGQLILMKITKIGATRCQILRLKCTKFDFRWGSVPDPAGGPYSAPDPLAVFKGA